jgi:diacylglycerol kinase (ATP)
MPGIGIITNPHSKSNKRNPGRSKLLSYIVGRKGFQEITNTPDDLIKVAKHFLEQDIDIMAINGGDGTISHAISAFISCYGDSKPLPKILLLGGGTMNVVSRNLGIRGASEYILTRIVEAVSLRTNLKTIPLRTIKIDGRHGFLYADGTNAYLLEEFYKKKSGFIRGAWLGIKLSLSSLFKGAFFKRIIRERQIKFHPLPYVPIHHLSIGTYASTLAKMPLGLPMFGNSLKTGETFRAISISMPPHKLVYRFLLMAFYGKQGHFLGKHNFDASELRIVGDEPFRYTLDGELFTSLDNQVNIRLGQVLEFIIP